MKYCPTSDVSVSATLSSKGSKNIVDDPLAACRQLNERLSTIFRMLRDMYEAGARQSSARAARTGMHEIKAVL